MYIPLLSFPALRISNLLVSALEKQKLPSPPGSVLSSEEVEYFLICTGLNKKLLCLIWVLAIIKLLISPPRKGEGEDIFFINA
jgi:hypothetical protein